jgi:hypothetical protein
VNVHISLCFHSPGAGVMMAARALIQLFRVKNPALLHKKDRVSF